MLEKLFESLDEKVFTKDLKESLEAQFNESVEAKAAILAESKIKEQTEALNEETENKINLIKEEAEKSIEENKNALLDQVDGYLEKIVEEFVSEAKDTLTESIKMEKADLMLEAFDAMIVAGGVEISTIAEAKDENLAESKLAKQTEKYDELINENIELQKENENLLKTGIINEMSKDLTIVEAEKFKKIADLIEFSKDETYVEKLKAIKESITSTKDDSDKDGDKDGDKDIEDKSDKDDKKDKVNESLAAVNYDHLI